MTAGLEDLSVICERACAPKQSSLLFGGPGLRRLALAVAITEKKESVAEKDLHYCEPAKGRGLRHDPFNAIIAPRPIGWIFS
jgi:hypothetical protein